MRATFAAGTNTATNGVALAQDSESDVRVYKLIIGTPVSAGNVWLYNITNPLNASTANIGFKTTLPTFSSTNVNPGIYVVDFGPDGLPLPQGGNLLIDATMNVTVMWELLSEVTGG